MRLSYDRMITSCKFRGPILRVPFPFIKKWFSFCILWLLGRMDVYPVLAFIATVRLCKVDWSTLGDRVGSHTSMIMKSSLFLNGRSR